MPNRRPSTCNSRRWTFSAAEPCRTAAAEFLPPEAALAATLEAFRQVLGVDVAPSDDFFEPRGAEKARSFMRGLLGWFVRDKEAMGLLT